MRLIRIYIIIYYYLSRTEKVLVYREIVSKEEALVHWEGFQR